MGRERWDGLGAVGRRLGAAMRTYLALGLVLVVLTSPAQGQNWDRWFRVSWGSEANGKTPTARIEASVHNDSPYRVTDVELEVEGLSADQHSVGRRFVWALGDIDPGSESSFVAEAMPGAVTYRITVVSFDIVSAAPPR
jgi:hypothetical protein